MSIKPHHHHHHHDIPIPKPMLAVAGALVFVTLVGVAFVTQTGIGRQDATPMSLIVAARTVEFDDADNGEVIVRDTATEEVIDRLAASEGGFVRAAVRALARRRAGTPHADDHTFRIERRENGQVLLIDPFTDSIVDLRAFGPDNAADFARYLDNAGVPMRSAQEINQ
ncbi:MAG: photosynthetic complex assembly protein PuhC [Pseudomonadota bacterium]